MILTGVGFVYDLTNELMLGSMSSVEFGAETDIVEVPLGDELSNKKIVVAQDLTGTIGFRDLRSATFASLIGGTVVTGTTVQPAIKESQTVSTATITLDNTSITNGIVTVRDENGYVYNEVGATPTTYEYIYTDQDTLTFNASQNGTVIYVSYIYADATSGATVTVGASGPSSFDAYLCMKATDLYRSPDTVGYVMAKINGVTREGAANFGASGREASDIQFTFSATGMTVYFPGDANQY